MASLTYKPEQEILTPIQRWTGLYISVMMLLLLGFFAYHQRANTGFFTEEFSPLEMIALYGPIILAIIPPIQRLAAGKRNLARPLEALSDMSLAVGSLWLRHVFPFSFAHLADPFPTRMHFAFAWLTDQAGSFILLLQVVVGFISALAILATYISTRRKEAGTSAG